MRRVVYLLAAIALLLAACTGAQVSDEPPASEEAPAANATTPAPAPEAAPAPTPEPTPAAIATGEPQAAAAPATTTTTVAQESPPAKESNQSAPSVLDPSPEFTGDPILTEPAFIPSVTVTVGGSTGPITVDVSPTATEAVVTFDAVASPAPVFGTWIWYVGGTFDSLSFLNPTSNTIALSIPLSADAISYTVEAVAFNDGFGSDTIQVLINRLSS